MRLSSLVCGALLIAGAAAAQTEWVLSDVTDASGITFQHVTGAAGEKHMPETMGAGVVFFDYDGDDDPDLLFVNGGSLERATEDTTISACALFRNDGGGKFVDVTEESGLTHFGYGMGATAGDYDNDGDQDLYVTHYGPNRLFRNQGDGSFLDESDALDPATVSGFSASAAWADVDNDGALDLYVTNYVDWSFANNPLCAQTRDGESIRAYCLPDAFRGVPDELYRNTGTGRFEAVGATAGIARPTGKGLGVISLDFDDDGWTDFYVANDTIPNFLFRNLGELRFEEVGLLVGTSYDADGNALAGMGVAHADYDRDGDTDLFVTNFEGEANTLYRNEASGFFTDVSLPAGVGRASIPRLGFGALFADMDNDSDDDLIVANGHVLDNAELLFGGSYRQPNQGFRNDGNTFSEVEIPGDKVSRGLAAADIDGDFDLDLVFSSSGDTPTLLRNDSVAGSAVRVILVGRRANRDGVGAVIDEVVSGGSRRIESSSASSYLSQSERVIHLGIGSSQQVDRIRVRWPGGATEQRGPFEAGTRVVWVEGKP